MSELQIYFKICNILFNHFYKSIFAQSDHCYKVKTVANTWTYFKSNGVELVLVLY